MKFLFVVVVFVISCKGFCSTSETDTGKDSNAGLGSNLLFTVAGSNTVGARLAPAWAKSYLEFKGATQVQVTALPSPNEYRVEGEFRYQPVYIDIRAHGSSTGFKALMSHTADVAMSSRPIKAQELTRLQKTHGDLSSFSAEHVVAIDGLAVIVHPDNPVSSMAVTTIAKVFSGQIKNWREVGGPDAPIRLLARDDKSGTWDTFKSLVLAKRLALHTSAERFESNDELSDKVSADPAAIGFVGLASVRNAKPLGVYEGETSPLKPEPLFVATEDYPLARRLFLYTPELSTNAYVREFVEFAKSAEGQHSVQSVGFISQNPMRVTVTRAGRGPRMYQDLTTEGERLSVNFRFKAGSAELDNKAKQDIRRLASYFRQPGNDHGRIQLVGFSHQERTDMAAHVLSKLRATAVKLELFSYGIKSEPVAAFGADILVADEHNQHAKSKNDRVEVWVIPDITRHAKENSSLVTSSGGSYAVQ